MLRFHPPLAADIARALAAAGADVNAIDLNGRTPLDRTNDRGASATAAVIADLGGRRSGNRRGPR